MKIKRSICKITELGIGAIAIVALILSGCGGGGAIFNSPASSALSVVALLGQFSTGATIRVKDKNGTLLTTGTVNASGVANVTVPTGAAAPLLIEAGINGDKYYDENPNAAGRDANGFVTISGVANVALRALVPDATVSAVGVTTLTEIAVGTLVNNAGALPTTITVASAVAANKVVADNYGVADVLLQPTPISTGGTIATATSGPDLYALKLAALANMAASGNNALGVAQALRDDANHSVPLPAGVITGMGGAVSGVGAAISAMNAAMASAATAIAAPSVLAAAQAITVPPPAVTDLQAAMNTYAQAAATATSTMAAPPTLAQIVAEINNAASSLVATINAGTPQGTAAGSVLASAASTASAVTATNDFIATATGTGLYNYVLAMNASGIPANPGFPGAASGIAPASTGIVPTSVLIHTASLSGGNYNVTATAKELLAGNVWGAPTTNPPAAFSYSLTATGWVHEANMTGISFVNNNDGTGTLTDPGNGGTYKISIAEIVLDGQPIQNSMSLSGGNGSSVYPTGSRRYIGTALTSAPNAVYSVSRKSAANGPKDPVTGVTFTSESAVASASSWCARQRRNALDAN